MGDDLTEKDDSYVYATNTSTIRLNTCLVTVVCCLLQREKRGGHRQKTYGETYARIVETTKRLLIRNVRGFVKHCS